MPLFHGFIQADRALDLRPWWLTAHPRNPEGLRVVRRMDGLYVHETAPNVWVAIDTDHSPLAGIDSDNNPEALIEDIDDTYPLSTPLPVPGQIWFHIPSLTAAMVIAVSPTEVLIGDATIAIGSFPLADTALVSGPLSPWAP